MKAKKYWEMTAAELAAATKQLDEPFAVDRSRPLTPAECRQWKRRRGRPKTGQGYKRISVSIEKGLLKKVTAFAKKHRVSRSRLFADVLTEALASNT
jgi:hypothetical protein